MAAAPRVKYSTAFLLLYALLGVSVGGSVEGWVIPFDYFFPFKVAIIPVLLLFVAVQSYRPGWLLGALLFSWIGDITIHFTFMGGVASFLVAHLVYAYGFYRQREQPVRPRWWIFFSLPVYIGLLMGLLLPHTGEFTLPVMLYALAISGMLITALYVQPFVGKWWLVAGAICFVISDSVIAINKFAYPFEGADVLIMGSYMLAQLGLVMGSVHLYKKVGR